MQQGAVDEPLATLQGASDTAAASTDNGTPGSMHDDKEPGAKKRKAEHDADVGQEQEHRINEATNVL